ncbi:hypothetical protein VPH35_000088 [Triticum aestivum]
MLPTGAEAQHPASYWVQSSSPSNSESQSGNTSSDGGLVQLEAKSPRNGAWFDVAAILSSRFSETGDQEIVSLRKVCRRPSADVKIDIVFDHSLAEQKAQKSHKRMDVNPDEVPVVPSPPNQGGPSDKLAAPLLISPDSTHRDSVADVQMGDIEAAPNGESTSKAHGDKMNVGA